VTPRSLFRAVVVIAGVALFARSIRVIGLDEIIAGVERVGWGFAAVLVLSGAREVARTLAWMQTVEGDAPLRFANAFRARLAGEALNTLLPMGMVVGEPTKASLVGAELPFATAFKALLVEFAFYTVSLVLLFGAGVAAYVASSGIPAGTYATTLGAASGAVALIVLLSMRWSAPLGEVVTGFASRRRKQVRAIAAYEITYHLTAIAEVYVTLALISPVRPTLAAAVVLETVNRVVTMVFKMLPLRVGVDEVSASLFAARVDLSPATGITLALVRKLRLLVWSAVGLALLVRRPATTAATIPRRNAVILSGVAIAMVVAASAGAAQSPAAVAGSVSIAGPDGQPLVIPGVTLTLSCAGQEPKTVVSDDQGQFRFSDLAAAGACSIAAELQGFKSATQQVELKPGGVADVALQLGLDTLREEVTVSARPEAVTEPVRAKVERISSEVIQTAPIASERFQAALPLIPGVVRGPDGLLNISGARGNQSALTLNDANGTDPVTGEDAIEAPIDAVSSVQVRGAAYAPEFGLSAGAVTSVETQSGGDAWHVTLNDLEPRVRRRGGRFKGIESWTPRVTVGGPVVKAKLSVLQSVQYEFSQTQVFGLPPFESDTKLQSLASFTRGDWTASPTHRFTALTMASPRKTTYAGLNTLNPQEVAANIKNQNFLVSGSDQIIVSNRGVFETRVSAKQFDSTIYPSVGDGPMVLAPDVNSGSYFNRQDRGSRRLEWLNTYAWTPFGPAHVLKVGAGVTRESFDGVNLNGPIHIVRPDRTLSQLIAFTGSGELSDSKTTLLGYAQDAWTAGSRLTVQYGGRYDYDSVTGDLNLAPRASVTALATADGRTVIRAGVGLFYSAVPLNVAAFDQMQRRVVTSFADDGLTPIGPPTVLSNVTVSELRATRSVNGNVEVDREWVKNLFVRVGYRQRENRFEPVVDVGPDAILLRTNGRSRYREGQVSARYQFKTSDQIVGSYTRSSAVGSLNEFNGFFGNLENPVIRPDAQGALPWDAPNRVLLWGSLSLPRGFAVFPVLDVRTGFPLSNVDADRNFVGPRNEGRYPTFVSLDAQVTKRFRLFNHNATIGLKVFNITDHFNPRDYQGNIASRNFGHFDNSVGRTFRGKWVFEF
jgi:Carboxypeptidase regulatory-like domain